MYKSQYALKSLLALTAFLLSLTTGLALADDAEDIIDVDIDDTQATVQKFLPQGLISSQTRISVLFSDEVVPLGEPNAPDPFKVKCPTGKGRWSNQRTWIWQMSRPLKAGELCSFTLKKNQTSWQGLDLIDSTDGTGYQIYSALPDVWLRQPYEHSRIIDEQQIFIIDTRVVLTNAQKQSTLQKRVWCEVKDIGNRIPVKEVNEEIRAKVLDITGVTDKKSLLFLQCLDRLPPNSDLRLVWKKQSFHFTVRDRFVARMSCHRASWQRGCLPLASIKLHFNADVSRQQLSKIRLITADDKTEILPSLAANGVSSISFTPPFNPSSVYHIRLPDNVKDGAGRPLANHNRFPLKITIDPLPPLAKFSGRFAILEHREGGILPITVRGIEFPIAPDSGQKGDNATHSIRSLHLTDNNTIIHTRRQLADFESQTKVKKRKSATKKIKGEDEEIYQDYHYPREVSFLKKYSKSRINEFNLPASADGTPASQTQVIGIPLNKPGFYIVEVKSTLLSKGLLEDTKPVYARTSALVTNLAVHMKWIKSEDYNKAMVWVTALDSGRPVRNAKVSIYCKNNKIGDSETARNGLASLDLPYSCKNEMFAFARLGKDLSFTSSRWDNGFEPWRFEIPTWPSQPDLNIHAIFDRPMFRAGETMSAKLVARLKDLSKSSGLTFPDLDDLPTKLEIVHRASDARFAVNVKWQDNASATMQWKIPNAAKRGAYLLVESGESVWSDKIFGKFHINDFRLPAFTGDIAINKAKPQNDDASYKTLPLAMHLAFINGGSAAGANIELSATRNTRRIEFERYSDFDFNYRLHWLDKEIFDRLDIPPPEKPKPLILDRHQLQLDNQGTAFYDLNLTTGVSPTTQSGGTSINAEMTFADPNGEIQTIRKNFSLWSASVVTGTKIEKEPDAINITVVTADTNGQPLGKQDITVYSVVSKSYVTRRRIVGGFYGYDTNWTYDSVGRNGVVCQGQSNESGIFSCKLKNNLSQDGFDSQLNLVIKTTDENGSPVYTAAKKHLDSYYGSEYHNHDRIDIIPEQKSVNPGDQAIININNPFARAYAWVSVEAERFEETKIIEIGSEKNSIKLDVKPEWGPNVYVSAFVFRGRVSPTTWKSFFDWGWSSPISWFKQWWQPEPLPASGKIDLAKPAFRLGITGLQVGLDAHRLQVEVNTNKKTYKPGETIHASFTVTDAKGKPASNAELAVAAVDKALLELRPNTSWNILQAMVSPRYYAVNNATNIIQVLGKRHFGKKAVSSGGGGGKEKTSRELFDTLLQWRPNIKLDKNGKANVEITANDSLTSFTIVGVVTQGESQFGTGKTNVNVTKNLQILPGLPPVVREGDKYKAMATLRNRTDRDMKIMVNASMQNTAGQVIKKLPSRTVDLSASSNMDISWTAIAPQLDEFASKEDIDKFSNSGKMQWQIDAEEISPTSDNKKTTENDSLVFRQQLLTATPVRALQADFHRVKNRKLNIPVSLPTTAVPANAPAGGIEVNLSASLAKPPPNLIRYFREYPYSCLEQRVSKAIGLNSPGYWSEALADLPLLMDSNGLLRYFDYPGRGSEVLTSYVLTMASLNDKSIPPQVHNRLINGLLNAVEGRLKKKQGSSWWNSKRTQSLVLTVLEATTRAAASSTDKQKIIKRSRKALQTISIHNKNLQSLSTGDLINLTWISYRLSATGSSTALLKESLHELTNRFTFSSGRLLLTDNGETNQWWLMSSASVNGFRMLDLLLNARPGRFDKTLDTDELAPMLVRGLIDSQKNGHWQTTTANAWASVMMRHFAKQFEKEQVNGITSVNFGEMQQQQNWSAPARPITFTWAEKTTAGSPSQYHLDLEHQGKGEPWANVTLLAAIPVPQKEESGFTLNKAISPVQQKTKGKFSRGDILKITLSGESHMDISWVVIHDPVPAGAKIVGDGDNRESLIVQNTASNNYVEGQRPIYVERLFHGINGYYEWLGKGKFTMSYLVRLNNTGEFQLPATHIEALYAPDIYALAPNKKVIVE